MNYALTDKISQKRWSRARELGETGETGSRARRKKRIGRGAKAKGRGDGVRRRHGEIKQTTEVRGHSTAKRISFALNLRLCGSLNFLTLALQKTL
jgi:hypothetical protein